MVLAYFTKVKMITSQTYSNIPVIRITDGKKLGEVKDLYLDRDIHMAVAIYLGVEGFFNRNAQVMNRGAVLVYGTDAWLVSGGDHVVRLADIPDSDAFTLASHMRGRAIETEGGTKIGEVDDVIFDSEAHVIGFSLRNLAVHGPLDERKVIAREAVTDMGSKDSPMTILLSKAESLQLLPELLPG
jgi:uncharacterized protein YrrD